MPGLPFAATKGAVVKDEAGQASSSKAFAIFIQTKVLLGA